MERNFTLRYWIDEEWYVGRLVEVPGVFSQGETLEDLKDNIRDCYRLIMEDEPQVEVPEGEIKEVVIAA